MAEPVALPTANRIGSAPSTNTHHQRIGTSKSAHSKIESGNQNGEAETWLNDMP